MNAVQRPSALGAAKRKSPGLIVALDTADRDTALRWADAVAPYAPVLKLGLTYFTANGPQGVRAITQRPFFLDLKLHDIPATVAGAVSAVLPLHPAMLTLHAAGGGAMIAAACRAAQASPSPPLLLAVTVLTSLDEAAMAATGIAGEVRDQVLRLARLALDAGAGGLVCSPHEVAALRDRFGPDPVLVVPGIRPAEADTGDQARSTTPQAAARAGADWIVVGRPITAAPDPGAAARTIALSVA